MGQDFPFSRLHGLTHTDTPNAVGLLWTGDQSNAETSTWKHPTLRRDRYSRHWRDSNLQAQKSRGLRPTPSIAQPLGSALICRYIAETEKLHRILVRIPIRWLSAELSRIIILKRITNTVSFQGTVLRIRFYFSWHTI